MISTGSISTDSERPGKDPVHRGVRRQRGPQHFQASTQFRLHVAGDGDHLWGWLTLKQGLDQRDLLTRSQRGLQHNHVT